ncbi:PREDICTED: CMRF35-like molecule 4 [Galeopterus variegatus]|uniref:CMRF35-like molecule 4 n=1 Tax=Galeopterus variegatus TaxID=482537 RepID=A0ABM0RH06_GALVR|nr:PREDICTED: CMRF35-like molecule 4 [Galeopterus variegatus]
MDVCFPVISDAKDAITSPEAVSGVERGSLTVQCHYDGQWETHRKWWCRGAIWKSCKTLVKTTGSEQMVKMDRVSIRDDQKSHTFTVTMEDLRRDDADTYWCVIERTGIDLGVAVKVTIDPGNCVYVWMCPSGPALSWVLRSHSSDLIVTQSDLSQRVVESLLSSVHFLLLVFLEVPLLLGMVAAVLWVNRP